MKGNNDLLVLTQPAIIGGIHRGYLEAGADILETCTFNSTAVSQADYKLEPLVHELNFEGARLARVLCDEFTAANPAKPRFVAGVLGPTSRTASTRNVAATLPLYQWIERGGLEIMTLGRDELVNAIDWITRYADRPMDLADASLVVAALKTGCTNIWTLDRSDFETYRLPGRKHFKLV